MRFYTEQECEGWLRNLQRRKPDTAPGMLVQRIKYPSEPYRIFGFGRWIAASQTYRMPTLLWVTESGIWDDSENLHLYYRLRQTYGDYRLLHEAPGHLFLAHETEDLASFLQIGMLNGWGGYVLTQAGYVNALFSHDDYFDFFAETDGPLDEVREAFKTSSHARSSD